ncbi:molecular chaperone DnaJ [Rubinisphaera sp. ICM_H10]|nr:molecular chaperone DnaJ [Rubinisphaera margarita]MCG6157924.1 molecular chaperone DnaJ [Rubinisphaera margarita]
MMVDKRDYYEVLGVERTATIEEIKKAYRKIAVKNHPDRNPGDDEAVERFKEASEAYDALSNQEKRARYDRYGHAGMGAGGAGGSQFHDIQDIFDAFGDFFGGGGRSRSRSRGPARGDHLQVRLTLDLLEAAKGCTKTVKVKRNSLCHTCDGSGAKPGTKPVTCEYCGGAGQVVQSQGFFRVQTTCPNCGGQGTVIEEKCQTCWGSGFESEHVELEVKIPAGVDTGMQLCLRGEGNPGRGGGPRGDLFVQIQVRDHPLFQREGTHLICRVPITFSQAALGTEIEIPVLDGKTKLNIPAGTQPNDTIRLQGRGIPDPQTGRVGDLHVELNIEVPKKLNAEQQQLLRELAEHDHVHVSAQRKTFWDHVKEFVNWDADEDAS